MLKDYQIEKFRKLYYKKKGVKLSKEKATRLAIIWYKHVEVVFKESGSDFVPKIVIKKG